MWVDGIRIGRAKRESGTKISLFLLGEDTSCEAGEVASGAGNEARYAGKVDDVSADVESEREWERRWFHGEDWRLEVSIDRHVRCR